MPQAAKGKVAAEEPEEEEATDATTQEALKEIAALSSINAGVEEPPLITILTDTPKTKMLKLVLECTASIVYKGSSYKMKVVRPVDIMKELMPSKKVSCAYDRHRFVANASPSV